MTRTSLIVLVGGGVLVLLLVGLLSMGGGMMGPMGARGAVMCPM